MHNEAFHSRTCRYRVNPMLVSSSSIFPLISYGTYKFGIQFVNFGTNRYDDMTKLPE